jgi:hypothetical protein
MKKALPLIYFLLILSLNLHGQKDTIKMASTLAKKEVTRETININVTIFPVPVKDNSFTIKTEKGISFVKVTNIIGQDILRSQYTDPQQQVKISLDSPKRGMYLVTIVFTDGIRVVKKIMVEQSE